MSDFSSTPPPPSPPIPPPPAPAPQFDFARPFTFAFQDPRWVSKVLIGGLFYLASFLIVGLFFVFGYGARLTRNVIAGDERLPEWDDLGEYFSEGARLFGVVLLYFLPLIVMIGVVIVPVIIAEGVGNRNMQELAGGLMGCLWCLITPFSLALNFWIPAALVNTAVRQELAAGFAFGEIFGFIKNNFVNYLLAFVIYLIVSNVAGIGVFFLCIGVFFTAFLALVIETYAFAYAYRLAKSK